MPNPGGGSRRFLYALAAMLLVTCSLPHRGLSSSDPSSASVPHALAIIAGTQRTQESGIEVPRESAEALSDRGEALLAEGYVEEAVSVLEGAVLAWEKEVGLVQYPLKCGIKCPRNQL